MYYSWSLKILLWIVVNSGCISFPGNSSTTSRSFTFMVLPPRLRPVIYNTVLASLKLQNCSKLVRILCKVQWMRAILKASHLIFCTEKLVSLKRNVCRIRIMKRNIIIKQFRRRRQAALIAAYYIRIFGLHQTVYFNDKITEITVNLGFTQ